VLAQSDAVDGICGIFERAFWHRASLSYTPSSIFWL